MAKKAQNEKMAPAPVAVTTHEKTKRKSSLEVGFIAKIAIFGQKMPKKSRFALRKAPFGKILQIRLRILNFQNFSL